MAFDNPSKLSDSAWQEYVDEFDGGLGKTSIRNLQAKLKTSVALDIHPNPVRLSTVISFTSHPSTSE